MEILMMLFWILIGVLAFDVPVYLKDRKDEKEYQKSRELERARRNEKKEAPW